MKTQAVVISEPGKVGLQEVTLKQPAPRDVIVETVYTSISSGTERMLLSGQMPHPMLQLPVIPGYETVGQVVEVGAEVSEDWLNRWVYVGGAMCYDGINGAWGGQSAKLFVDVGRLVPLDNLKPELGVLLALTATSLHGVDVLNPAEGERILIIGQGPVGQLAARIAQARGAWVAVTDLSAERLHHAQADLVVNVSENQLVLDEPVHAIIEASGSMQALSASLGHLAPNGTVLLLGYYQTLEVPYMPLFLKEAKILAAKEWGANDLAISRDMIAEGKLKVDALLTHHLAIDEIARAYDLALNDLDCLKIILNWRSA